MLAMMLMRRSGSGVLETTCHHVLSNCIKLGLPGKSILGYYFQENRTSRRPFLLLRISFPGRPNFIQFIPGHEENIPWAEEHTKGLGGSDEGVGLAEALGVIGVQVHGAEPVGERRAVGAGALVEARLPFSKARQ